MTGIATLFPPFPPQMPLLERVNITILRHNHNYFKDWSIEQLNSDDILDSARPLSPPITNDIHQANIKKNEVSRNRRLAFCITSAETENAPR